LVDCIHKSLTHFQSENTFALRSPVIAGCLAARYNPSMMSATEGSTEQSLGDYASDGEDILPETDDDLLVAIEDMALAEEHNIGQADEEEFVEGDEWLENIENGYLPSSPVQIPRKRGRY